MIEHDQDPEITEIGAKLRAAFPHQFRPGFADRVMHRIGRERDASTPLAGAILILPRAFAWSLAPALVLLALVAWHNFQLSGDGAVMGGLADLGFDAGSPFDGELR